MAIFESFGTCADWHGGIGTDDPFVLGYATDGTATLLTAYGPARYASETWCDWRTFVFAQGRAADIAELRRRERSTRLAYVRNKTVPQRIRVTATRACGAGREVHDDADVFGWRAALVAARALRLTLAHDADERDNTMRGRLGVGRNTAPYTFGVHIRLDDPALDAREDA